MKEKHILGLDLGTNSIGWAIIKETFDDEDRQTGQQIVDAGCRIIPMDAAMQSNFAKGTTVSQTHDRTQFRGIRRRLERQHLRRERLHRVLAQMDLLPAHYLQRLDRYGKFLEGQVPLLPWDTTGAQPRFLFQDAYQEMLALFHESHSELIQQGLKVPYDWTIYYLRQKALTQAITGEELAWILLQFNQKRGYYQARGEEQEEDKSKSEEYFALRVVDVVDSGEKRGKDTWWNVVLENGMIYRRTSPEKPDWTDQVKEFIITTQLDGEGLPKLDKEGNVRRSLRMPKDDDWGLLKIKTQHDISRSGLTVGAYIFQALLANPKQKILGKLVRTIDREFYHDELIRIVRAQQAFLPQLTDRTLYKSCITTLYGQNEAYRQSILSRDFVYLLVDDILFYQRPLKRKMSLIGNCPYEGHAYRDDQGETAHAPVKCIARSHPLFQEFRLWHFVSNLRIYKVGADGKGNDVDVTADSCFLPDREAYCRLFDYLNDRSSITEKELLEKYFGLKKGRGKQAVLPFRWNYVQDKTYPSNTTRGDMLLYLEKAGIPASFLTCEVEENLWHLLYSVSDRQELRKALGTFAYRHGLDDRFAEVMIKFPPFEREYGAYSAKAIRRLLPLMRMGHHWQAGAIDDATRQRIDHLLNGEVDDTIRKRVREKSIHLTSIEDFQGLPLWLACYVVYDRHSEAADVSVWKSPDDIDCYLSRFRQHSLRNPVVEQVVLETLRTVRDLWKHYEHIDEIHVEIGRDLKNPADKRARMTEQALRNENANLRVKALLTEFLNPELGIENVRPYSPNQQDLLRIYEETALQSVDEMDEDIDVILKKFAETEPSRRPTRSEVKRYGLWLEQHYVSPYTGRSIPLSRLFTTDYEIEHVIPQSRYFDDSFSNKVICEAEVNKLKDSRLAAEFIKSHGGEVVPLCGGREVKILDYEAYCDLIKRTYKHNSVKMKKLLMDDIPEEFVQRQLNDSRYISKLIVSLLSNLVREEGEEEATAKHLIVCSGSVTDRLKREWGIHQVWNDLILPRFLRMNELTGTGRFTATSSSGHLIPDMPLELQRGFQKKRIDHRHHAMDAIVIACTTRDHVNLLSNEAASSKSNLNRLQLSHKLRRYEEVTVMREGKPCQLKVAKEFLMPWPSFPSDVKEILRGVVVSFKQNLRVINKSSNHSVRFVEGRKRLVPQSGVISWAIRKPMHKETVFGEVNLWRKKSVNLKEAMKNPLRIVDADLKSQLRALLAMGYTEKQIKQYFADHADSWPEFNAKKIEVYYFTKETSERFFAVRKSIDTSFDAKKIREQVTDTGIQRIMLRHLARYNGNAELAFSPDGIEVMNRTLTELNDGHPHQPISKVRLYEKADKFAVGERGNKGTKFVEAAKGTNLFFAVYEKEEIDSSTGEVVKKRSYRTIPLNEAIWKMKQGVPLDEEATFILSPGDLVYLPTEQELRSGTIVQPLDKGRIYKLVSSNKFQGFFVQSTVASTIQDKFEFSPLNKMERAITGEMVKEICIPIQVDRLGRIIKIGV